MAIGSRVLQVGITTMKTQWPQSYAKFPKRALFPPKFKTVEMQLRLGIRLTKVFPEIII